MTKIKRIEAAANSAISIGLPFTQWLHADFEMQCGRNPPPLGVGEQSTEVWRNPLPLGMGYIKIKVCECTR